TSWPGTRRTSSAASRPGATSPTWRPPARPARCSAAPAARSVVPGPDDLPLLRVRRIVDRRLEGREQDVDEHPGARRRPQRLELAPKLALLLQQLVHQLLHLRPARLQQRL